MARIVARVVADLIEQVGGNLSTAERGINALGLCAPVHNARGVHMDYLEPAFLHGDEGVTAHFPNVPRKPAPASRAAASRSVGPPVTIPTCGA